MSETLKEELARLERQRDETIDSQVRAIINNRIAELKRQLEKLRTP
jgi:predicted negative regulator of RcsB-dependent stress response